MKRKVYSEIASRVIAIGNCINSKNTEWQAKHETALEEIVKEFMPRGSGFDSGTTLDIDAAIKCNAAKLVFNTSFHHMNDGGYYNGWTSHVVTVSPSLAFDFTLKISGRDRNGIKEYMHDVFNQALNTEV